MADQLYVQFDGWVEGVNTTLSADDLPTNALPHARNSAITHTSSGKAVVETRPGWVLDTASALSTTNAVIGLFPYDTQSAGTVTRRLLAHTADGALFTSGTDRVFSSVSSTAFTAGSLYTDTAVAQNQLFMVNGTDAKVYNGTSLTTMGITRPTVGSMAGAAGSAGSHNGTYELRVTYGISATGSESSASNTAASTVTVASKQISWSNVPVSSNPLVDRRYLYVRNTATQANFYRAGTIADNSTTTATTNIADASLVTIAPGTTANNAPPSGIRYIAYHRSRMFVADAKDVYWSQLGQPMAFNTVTNVLNVNPNDGQVVTGLKVFNDVLMIFKERSTYLLVGDDPNSWVIRLLTPAIGCTGFRSIVIAEHAIYWWSHEGPVYWTGESVPSIIGKPYILQTLTTAIYQWQGLGDIVGGYDPADERVLWAVPFYRYDANGSTNYIGLGGILPFSTRLLRWESTGWESIRVGAFATTVNASNALTLYLGGMTCSQVFHLGGTNDGVPSGTTSGTFTAGGATTSSITGTGFLNTGGKLVERPVVVQDSLGRFVAQRYITTNNATTLTLDTSFATTSGAVYTYYVGGINFEMDTPWHDHGEPFLKKRYQYLYMLFDRETPTTPVYVDLTFDTHDDTTNKTMLTCTPTAGSDFSSVPVRLRVGRTGRVIRARISCRATDTHLSIGAIGLRAEKVSDRLN